MHPESSVSSAPRIEILDGLRFTAALAVLLYHYAFRIWTGDSGIIAYPVLGPIAQYGYLGVDVFFMISGFVILMTAEKGGLRDFLVSRVIRLYPAYWFCVLATFIFLTAWSREAPDLLKLLVNLSMFQSLFGIEHMDGSYWTLVVELCFYALILSTLALRQIGHIEIVLALWLASGIATDFIPILAKFQDIYAASWCQYFVAGALAYRIRTKGLNLWRLGLYTLAFVQAERHGLWYMDLKHRLTGVAYEPVIMLSFIGVAFLLFLGLALGRLEWRHPVLRHLGAITYPLYLIHAALGTTLLLSLVQHGINHWVALAGVSGGALTSAWAIHRFVEKPLARRLKRWFSRNQKIAAVAPISVD
jgi:peptidoglycan/LPS O-acetylase OafA/YrhL